MKILIAEDELTSRKIVSEILAPIGTCDCVDNGLEALKAFRESWNSGNPYNLILLDIVMPQMDGITALQEIRKLEAEKHIEPLNGVRVIITTAHKDREKIYSAFKSNAEAYLVKPISKQNLLKQIQELGLQLGL